MSFFVLQIVPEKSIPLIWFLLTLVLLFALLFWVPIQVEIDTQQQIYRARWRGIFGIRVLPEEKRWRWFFQVFFWEKEWKSGKNVYDEKKRRGKKPAKQKAAGKRKMPFTLRQGRALFRNLFHAIKVKRLHLNWDTGDFVRNAWLYPAFRMANRGKRQLFINFSGQQELAIQLQTRLGLLTMAFLRTFFISKK